MRKRLLRLLGSWKNRRKKLLKKAKKQLAANDLASSENSSSSLEECGETRERPKKKKRKQKFHREWNGRPTCLFIQTQEKEVFVQEDLISSDLEETRDSGSLLKRKKSFPKEEPVSDPEEAGNRSVPPKRGNSLPRRSHSAVDLKRLVAARAVAPSKRKVSKSFPRTEL